MSEPQAALLRRARQQISRDPRVRDCWELVVHAIELGWLDRDELTELIEQLGHGRDAAIDELTFAHLGDQLRISLLDDHATCAPAAMLAALTELVT